MPFIPAPAGTYRSVFQQNLQGQEIINVLHVETDGGVLTLADMQDLVDSLALLWSTTVSDNVSDELTLEQVILTDVEVANGRQVASSNTPFSGQEVGFAAAPNTLAMLASFRTAQSGRSHRGRWYQAGMRQSVIDTDSNLWLAAAVNEFGIDMTAFIDGVNLLTPGLATVQAVVTSYYSGVDVNGDPIPRVLAVNTPITSVTARQVIAVQRRRRPRFA